MIAPERAVALRDAQTALEVPAGDLWMSYLGLGGDLPFCQVEAFLAGLVPIDAGDYDRLAQVVNELFMDRDGGGAVPYADEM